MRKKFLYLTLIFIVILGGCTKKSNISESEQQEPAVIAGAQDQEIIERSELISDIIVDMYSIDDATTIIFNDTAIIGIKIAYNQKMNEELKNSIIEKVKESDPLINQVKVTTKANIFSQIDNILGELLQGKSYDSFVNEINKIQNKIK